MRKYLYSAAALFITCSVAVAWDSAWEDIAPGEDGTAIWSKINTGMADQYANSQQKVQDTCAPGTEAIQSISDDGTTTCIAVGGDVSGPDTSTDGAVAVYDGATGKLIKDSSIAVSGNDLTVPGFINIGAQVPDGERWLGISNNTIAPVFGGADNGFTVVNSSVQLVESGIMKEVADVSQIPTDTAQLSNTAKFVPSETVTRIYTATDCTTISGANENDLCFEHP